MLFVTFVVSPLFLAPFVLSVVDPLFFNVLNDWNVWNSWNARSAVKTIDAVIQ